MSDAEEERGDAERRPADVLRAQLVSLYSPFKEHLALVVGGATLLLIAFRVLLLSSFQPLVAVAVIATGDPAKIALATVVGALPVAFPLLAAVAATAGLVLYPQWAAFPLFGVSAFFVLLTFATGPSAFLAVLLILLVEELTWVRAVFGQMTEEAVGRSRMRFHRFVRSMVVFSVLIGAVALLPPFLPTEAVTFDDGTQRVGYVVSTDGQWTTILSNGNLTTVLSTQVVARQVCDGAAPELLQPGLLKTLLGQSVPECPSAT